MSWLLHAALSSALLALVVAAVCRWRKPSPAAAHLLWLAVLLHLLLPPVGAWPVALVAVAAPATEQPAVTPSRPALHADTEPAPDSVAAAAPFTQAAESGARAAAAAALWPAALALWLAGALVSAARLARSLWRLHRAQMRGAAAPAALLELVETLARDAGVRCRRVRVTAEAPSACLTALGPTLLVPEHLCAAADRATLQAVILHELVHLRRRDHLLGWLEAAAQIVWWWNPVQWLARARMRAAAELACDAAVVARLPFARRSYAQALIDTVERMTAADRRPAFALGGFDKRGFAQRLRSIMTATPRPKISRGEAMLATMLTLVTFPAWSTTTAPTPDLAPQDPQRVPVRSEAAQPEPQQDRWRVEVSRQIDLPAAIRTLRLKTNSGDIEVVEGNGAAVQVDAVATAPKDRVSAAEVSQRFEDHVAVETSADTLSLADAHARPDRGETIWSVSLRVRVPRALGVHATTGSGDIGIALAADCVTAATGSGEVALRTPQAALTELKIKTGSGTIEADVDAVANDVAMSAGSGDVTLKLARTGQENGKLSAGSGDVTLRLPPAAGAEIELRTGTGELRAPAGIQVDERGRSARGTLGSGGARYQLTTGSGDIGVQIDGAREQPPRRRGA